MLKARHARGNDGPVRDDDGNQLYTFSITSEKPEPTSRKRPRKAPPAPRPKQRRKTKAAPVEPILSEYELGRRAKIKRNNKFLVSVGLLFPPKDALEDDEHPWWYMTAR